MPKLTDVLCGDLADDLPLCKDIYRFYQISPSLELTRDSAACPPNSSTPDRAQRGICLPWPDIPEYRDAYLPLTSTPRALVTSSASTLSVANMQTTFSPSPLPLSQVPSLVFPEISPPSQGSTSTPFERQFASDFSRGWDNTNTHISPVARKRFTPSLSLSPVPNPGEMPLRTNHDPTPEDSQDAVLGRVSLIDRFISAAADESFTINNDTPFLSMASQDHRRSPFSELSDLTSLSSDDSEHEFDLRSISPPSSRRPGLSQSSIQRYTQSRNSGRNPSPTSPSPRNSSRSSDSDYQPAKGAVGRKRKRTLQSRDGDETPCKRKKTWSTDAPGITSAGPDTSTGTLTRRRLPTNIPYNQQFPFFYLRFPVSSYLRLADGKFPLLEADSKRVAGTYNEPRDALDLYTPRFVKGCGATKVGMCPICVESPDRGGKGEAIWFSMKFSAYKWHVFGSQHVHLTDSHHMPNRVAFSFVKILNQRLFSYHMQYAHGISSVSARPFSPPVNFRTIERRSPAKNERTSIQEGKCHKCKKWVFVESIKNIDIKVKELYWWKHAAGCHQGTHIDGDDDFFLEDDIYRRVQQVL